MAKAMVLAVFCSLLSGVSAGTCAAGDKFKSSLTDLKCTAGTLTAAGCPACCEPDTTKCGGLATPCTVASHYVSGSDDAWENTAATEATKDTACCTARATCGASADGYTCPAGYKYKTGSTDNKCPTNKASCSTISGADADCCVRDETKCGGLVTPCTAATHYAKGSDDAWKDTAATDAPDTACCNERATCGASADGYTCPKGYKYRAGSTDNKCPTDKGSCATISGADTDCCMRDETKCGGLVTPCTVATHYAKGSDDAWKDTDATDTPDTACCNERATCGASADGYTCPAGYKYKAGSTDNKCPTNKASCATTDCCELDPLKCGGIATPCTAATHFPSGSDDAWKNTATTAASKQTDCCTERSTCAAFQSTTTTAGGSDASKTQRFQSTQLASLISVATLVATVPFA